MINRDLMILPLPNGQKLVVATDASGGCGKKDMDIIHVSNEVLSYFAARVAFMEVMSVRAKPIAYIISNFIKDGYEDIQKGIIKLLDELELENLQNITSTETNFEMLQSAVGISAIAMLENEITQSTRNLIFASVGYPLVGNEIVEQEKKMLSIKTFMKMVKDDKIKIILPVGSTGIKNEMNMVLNIKSISSEVDINKSAGPATCVIIGFQQNDKEYLIEKLGSMMNMIETVIDE